MDELLEPRRRAAHHRAVRLDAGSDGQSNVGASLPAFFSLPFISGVDLAIPASRPPDGRISVRLRSRGRGRVRAINIPNLPYSTDRISVQLNYFE